MNNYKNLIHLILKSLIFGLLFLVGCQPAPLTQQSVISPPPTAPLPTPTKTIQFPTIAGPITYTYQILNTYPHAPNAFTQGLIYFEDNLMYEGTGLRGRSTLRKTNFETGEVLQNLPLPQELFGEGITLYKDKIIQLTWQSHKGFVYDRESFKLLQEFTYPTEGWGITYDGQKLIMSDGTDTLYLWDPETFEEIGRIQVRDGGLPVRKLNELEYIEGEIYANIWQTNRIARIDPTTGVVLGWIDLTGLLTLDNPQQQVDVLNGIAYDAINKRLFVTGKLWPKLFEIQLIPSTR